jgi:prepilin-type processing-associated H-X9-DG protein
MDQSALYQSVGPDPKDFPAFWEPITGARIEVYLCPSESVPDRKAKVAGSSYAACFGSGSLRYGENGMFPAHGRMRVRDVRDGLSNTVAISEFRRGSARFERLRTIWQTPNHYSDPAHFEQLVTECDSMPLEPADYGWLGGTNRGFPWWYDDRGFGLYNHALTPNRPSCQNRTHVPTGIYTAGSLHPGGVNALYADGRVEFTSNSIDVTVWRSLGSRNERLPVN